MGVSQLFLADRVAAARDGGRSLAHSGRSIDSALTVQVRNFENDRELLRFSHRRCGHCRLPADDLSRFAYDGDGRHVFGGTRSHLDLALRSVSGPASGFYDTP